MKRFCLANNKQDIVFQEKDSDFAYDIDIRSIILQGESQTFNPSFNGFMKFMNGEIWDEEIRYRLSQIKYTSEFMMDMMNEIYLSLSYLEKKKVKLYLNGKSCEAQEFDAKMKNTIKNKRYKESKKRENEIFDIQTYLVEREQKESLLEIPEFGSGLVRLWLYSSDIRNILTDRKRVSNIYGIKRIVEKVEDVEDLFQFTDTDAILLERLFGILLEQDIEVYIVELLENEQIELNDLIKAIMEYHGEYVRSLLVQIIGYDLYTLKLRELSQRGLKEIGTGYDLYHLSVQERKELIKAYTECIKDNKDKYNEVYEKVHNDILKGYGKIYSVETTKKIVKRKRGEIKQTMYPTLIKSPISIKTRKRCIKKMIYGKKLDIIVDEIVNEKYAINKMPFFYFENEKNSLERSNLIMPRLDNLQEWKIEKNIIEGNMGRYKNRI